MSITESALWALIKRNLTDVHWARIESWSKQGIADVNGCHLGREFWMELKVTNAIKIKFKDYQPPWILKRARAGGIIWVCVRRKDTIRLYWGGRVRELIDLGWKLEPDYSWDKPWPWARMLEAMENHPPLEMAREQVPVQD
jgi:hypothetical protein